MALHVAKTITASAMRLTCAAAGVAVLAAGALADSMLADFAYPHPVKHFELKSQRQALAMAYMDIAPAAGVTPNGKTVVLLHGKNFCGATWESVIAALSGAGYRVIVPDQIGFCKSSKPEGYQFSLHQLADNTRALLRQLKIERPIVMGHSMGGMLAMRYALMYPQEMSGLVLLNPIGLEDWKAKGVPLATIDEWYATEQRASFEGMKKYQQSTYYAGQWKPEYDRWVHMFASMYQGEGGKRAAWNQAQASDMILSQPVVYELERIAVPTLLLIGEKDTTAIGKNRAPAELAKALGNYPVLAREAHARIKGSTLVTFPDMGHSPQIQDPARFNAVLLEGLGKLTP